MSVEPTIRRGVRNARYAAIPNDVFEETRLSMEARWLLGYLLSKPDNWTVRLGDIRNKGGCGKDKAQSMVKELIDLGYAEREEIRTNGKYAGSVLVVYDEPVSHCVANLSQPCLPAPAKPEPVNPPPSKTDNLAITDKTEDSPQPPEERGADAALADEGLDKAEEPLPRPTGKDKNRLEADFHRAFIDYPGYGAASKERAIERWLDISDEDRTRARAGIAGYVAACRADGAKPYAMAGYLKKREFWDHAAPAAALPMAKAYGKGWSAALLKRLFGSHAERMARPTAFIQKMIDQGGDAGRDYRARHLAVHGWPEVNRMLETATNRQGWPADEAELALGAGFKPVEVGTALWQAWACEFSRRGWPWFEASHVTGGFGASYVYLPDCGGPVFGESEEDLTENVREGLAAFEQALAGNTRTTGNSEAAE